MFLTFILSSACILVYQYQLSRARYISQDLDRASGDIEVLKLSIIKKLLSSNGGAENSTTSTTTTTTTPTTIKLINDNYTKNNNTIAQKRQTVDSNTRLQLANTNFNNNNNENDGNRCTCDHKDATNSERHVIILLFCSFICSFLHYIIIIIFFHSFPSIIRRKMNKCTFHIIQFKNFFYAIALELFFCFYKSWTCYNIGGQRASRTACISRLFPLDFFFYGYGWFLNFEQEIYLN